MICLDACAKAYSQAIPEIAKPSPLAADDSKFRNAVFIAMFLTALM